MEDESGGWSIVLLTKILARLRNLGRDSYLPAARFRRPPDGSVQPLSFRFNLVVIANVGQTRILQSNPFRVGVIFSCNSGTSYVIAPSTAMTVSGGIPVANNTNFEIFKERHGDLAVCEWYAMSTLNQTVAVVEYF